MKLKIKFYFLSIVLILSVFNSFAFDYPKILADVNPNQEFTQLQKLNHYQSELSSNSNDSITIFKTLAILYADLDKPNAALLYIEKYFAYK